MRDEERLTGEKNGRGVISIRGARSAGVVAITRFLRPLSNTDQFVHHLKSCEG
jgi:hypothetical protein